MFVTELSSISENNGSKLNWQQYASAIILKEYVNWELNEKRKIGIAAVFWEVSELLLLLFWKVSNI